MKNGLATLPDALEARSATAQAEYDLQAVLGAEEIARGDLATAVGTSRAGVNSRPNSRSGSRLPSSIGDTVDLAINRAFAQRPDLMQLVAAIRSANAKVQEARAAYYPSLSVNVTPVAQAVYGLQQPYPGDAQPSLVGGLTLNLNGRCLTGAQEKTMLHKRGRTFARQKHKPDCRPQRNRQ